MICPYFEKNNIRKTYNNLKEGLLATSEYLKKKTYHEESITSKDIDSWVLKEYYNILEVQSDGWNYISNFPGVYILEKEYKNHKHLKYCLIELNNLKKKNKICLKKKDKALRSVVDKKYNVEELSTLTLSDLKSALEI